MSTAWLPWRDHHEDLSLPRLVKLAAVLRDIWRRLSELQEPKEGDDMWSLSCRAFSRSAYRFNQIEWPWFSVIEAKNRQLILCIGAIPVRFYHGEPTRVPLRYAFAPGVEQFVRQGLLKLDDRIGDTLLRFATDTNAAGVPVSVSLVKSDATTGEVLESFLIPESAEAGGTVTQFPSPALPQGIQQAKPQPRPKTGRAKGHGDDAKS